jgi:hypothetical protein
VPDWLVFSASTALATTKHLKYDLDSSVLFEDIATTIDGGPGNSTGITIIINCISSGRSMGVITSSTNDNYESLDYLKPGAETDGILIQDRQLSCIAIYALKYETLRATILRSRKLDHDVGTSWRYKGSESWLNSAGQNDNVIALGLFFT